MIICLFGHRDAPAHIRPLLEQVLGQLITEYRADTMMVGQQGAFDRMASGVLRQLGRQYPFLTCCEVLAYPPRKKRSEQALETVLPEGIECVPPRFAIAWRNRWMVDRADIVVLYMTHRLGGTGAVHAYALRTGKIIINIAEI